MGGSVLESSLPNPDAIDALGIEAPDIRRQAMGVGFSFREWPLLGHKCI